MICPRCKKYDLIDDNCGEHFCPPPCNAVFTKDEITVIHQAAIIEAQDEVVRVLTEWGKLVVMNKDTDLANRVNNALAKLEEVKRG